jgi:uncharacterized coiled-coil DUF342 family protein
MDNSKVVTKILIAIIAILSIYTVLSGNSARKEIKRLTQELKLSVDSLNKISNQYDFIRKKYDTICSNFITTKEHFVSLQHNVDSLLHSSKNSVDKINSTLKQLIKEQGYIKTLPETKIDLPF